MGFRATVWRAAASSRRCLAFPATVDKLSYQGSETRVFLANEKDVSFEVSVRNASRDSAADPFKGRMWVAWKHADTLILSD